MMVHNIFATRLIGTYDASLDSDCIITMAVVFLVFTLPYS
jgi:hypothetical protein